MKVGEEGKLYGSVTNADIADSLAASGIEVDRHKIVLDGPIKELGDHQVPIKLSNDMEAEVKVSVVAEE